MDQQLSDATGSRDYRNPGLEYIVDSGGPDHRPLDLAYDSAVILEDHLRRFWEGQIKAAEEESFDFKHPTLPLARIKKVMKSDPDVKVSRGKTGRAITQSKIPLTAHWSILGKQMIGSDGTLGLHNTLVATV